MTAMAKTVAAGAFAAMFSAPLVLVGCGNACDDADDKVEECGVENYDQTSTRGEEVECEGKAECEAECHNNASCDDIKASFGGAQNAFTDCVSKC